VRGPRLSGLESVHAAVVDLADLNITDTLHRHGPLVHELEWLPIELLRPVALLDPPRGSTSLRSRSLQPEAGMTIVDNMICSGSAGFAAAQRAASATGALNIDTL
jgi:hypothetical protein